MAVNLKFHKTGKQIKEAMRFRIKELTDRLDKRNKALDVLMTDASKIRSYLIFSSDPASDYRGHHGDSPAELRSSADVSSEEEKEIRQLCRRIYEIEQELHQLKLARAHLQDDQELWLSMSELQGFGFKVVEDQLGGA